MHKRLSRRKTSPLTKSLLRFLRYWYLRLSRLQGHPHQIARGVAAGTFSGFFPWFGFQIIIAIIIAVLIRGNKIAAAAATWISNPLTDIPIFIGNYQVGAWLLSLGQSPQTPTEMMGEFESVSQLMDLGLNVILTTLLGSFWMGLIAAICTYFLSLKLIYSSRQTRRFRASLR